MLRTILLRHKEPPLNMDCRVRYKKQNLISITKKLSLTSFYSNRNHLLQISLIKRLIDNLNQSFFHRGMIRCLLLNSKIKSTSKDGISMIIFLTRIPSDIIGNKKDIRHRLDRILNHPLYRHKPFKLTNRMLRIPTWASMGGTHQWASDKIRIRLRRTSPSIRTLYCKMFNSFSSKSCSNNEALSDHGEAAIVEVRGSKKNRPPTANA